MEWMDYCRAYLYAISTHKCISISVLNGACLGLFLRHTTWRVSLRRRAEAVRERDWFWVVDLKACRLARCLNKFNLEAMM